MIQSPDFWTSRSTLSSLLRCFSFIPSVLLHIREYITKPHALSVPVICIGNATVGGTGKTPTALAIAALLKEQNIKLAFISKGYKGHIKEATKVDSKTHHANQVGDEPLLLARSFPCYVGNNRIDAANMAISDGAELLILDDGLQDPSIKKDLSFLVVDGGYGFGNTLLLPAGPLREPLKNAFSKANAVILIGQDSHAIAQLLPTDMPLLQAQFTPTQQPSNLDIPVVAFAGIGRPEKFFSLLKELNFKVKEEVSFSDHYPYSSRDILQLRELAKTHNATLITTEKDRVRLPENLRNDINVLPVFLEWKNQNLLKNLLDGVTKP